MIIKSLLGKTIFSVMLTIAILGGIFTATDISVYADSFDLSKSASQNQVRFIGIKDWQMDDDDMDVTYKLNLSPQMAYEIADVIFKDMKGEKFIKETEAFVYQIKGKNILVVCRGPKGDVDGGDYCIAIHKKSGRILKIWMGE